MIDRWEAWAPNDPATLSEVAEKEQEEEEKRSKEFEDNNPEFCKQMMDDMKTRAEARSGRPSREYPKGCPMNNLRTFTSTHFTHNRLCCPVASAI